jgi:outer membrane immunogenic protein
MKRLCAGLLGLTAMSAAAFSANAADMYGGLRDGAAYASAAWSGVYAGVNGGYGWTANGDINASGGFGGGQIGYNWQRSGRTLVLGIEADFQGAGISGSTVNGNTKIEDNLNWLGTVRGRIGCAMDRTLIYVAGGFAYGELESKHTPLQHGMALGVPSDVKETQTGYVLGGGIEHKFSPSWSMKGEYQFISLDANDAAGPLGGTGDRSEIHTVRAGLNYHF